MTLRKPIVLIFLLGTAMMLIAGCISPETTSPRPDLKGSPTIQITHHLLTPTPETTPIRTKEASSTFSPSQVFTPIPTIHPEQELHLVELLQADDCDLPCYLKIIPGETTLRDATILLGNLGASYWGDYERVDGSISHNYYLRIGDPSLIGHTPEPDNPFNYIKHDLSLVTDTNNKIQIIEIEFYAYNTVLMPIFREYWSKYSVRDIFLHLGLPDQIYIDSDQLGIWAESLIGYQMIFVYDIDGTVVEVSARKREGSICPMYLGDSRYMTLSLYNPDSKMSIYADGPVPPTDRDVWLPIEEVLTVDTQEFYDRLIFNPEACFELQD